MSAAAAPRSLLDGVLHELHRVGWVALSRGRHDGSHRDALLCETPEADRSWRWAMMPNTPARVPTLGDRAVSVSRR